MSFSVLHDSRSPEVHASTLLVVKSDLLSAWFGGTKEGFGDTKIWLSRRPLSDENGWSKPTVVAGSEGSAHWNPVLHALPNSTEVLLFYKVGSPISAWATYVKRSVDGGTSWSEGRELVPGDKGALQKSHSTDSEEQLTEES